MVKCDFCITITAWHCLVLVYIFNFNCEIYTLYTVGVMLASLFLTWRISFSNSWKSGLVVMNFLCFHLPGKDFIVLSFLKESFARDNVLGWHYFSFQHLKCIILLFPGLRGVFWEINRLCYGDPLYVMDYFFLDAFKIISLSFGNIITMCLCVDLFRFNLLGYLGFINLEVHFPF